MSNRSMGEIISTLRKEKGMTQKELADQLNITDKAVSKWERDLSCPDTQLLPRLAEIFGISLEALMNAKAAPVADRKVPSDLIRLILKAVPVAMGIAVAVTAVLGEIDLKSGLSMLGIGLACAGICLLQQKN